MGKAQLLSTNIVVLFEGGQISKLTLPTLVQQLGTEVKLEPVVTSFGVGLLINVLDEHLEITVMPRRLQVDDKTGQPPRKRKVPHLMCKVLPLLGEVAIRSFGFNYEVVFDSESAEPAAKKVAFKFLKLENLERMKLGNVQGAAIRALFVEGDKKHTLVIEPRLQDWATSKIFVSLNVHRDSAIIPKQEELGAEFVDSYSRMLKVINRLLR